MTLPTAEMIESGFEPKSLGDRSGGGRPAVPYSLMMYPSVRGADCTTSNDGVKAQCSYNVEWQCDFFDRPNNEIDLIEQRLDNFGYRDEDGWKRGAPVSQAQYFYLENGDWKQSSQPIIPC